MQPAPTHPPTQSTHTHRPATSRRWRGAAHSASANPAPAAHPTLRGRSKNKSVRHGAPPPPTHQYQTPPCSPTVDGMLHGTPQPSLKPSRPRRTGADHARTCAAALTVQDAHSVQRGIACHAKRQATHRCRHVRAVPLTVCGGRGEHARAVWGELAVGAGGLLMASERYGKPITHAHPSSHPATQALTLVLLSWVQRGRSKHLRGAAAGAAVGTPEL